MVFRDGRIRFRFFLQVQIRNRNPGPHPWCVKGPAGPESEIESITGGAEDIRYPDDPFSVPQISVNNAPEPGYFHNRILSVPF